MSGEGDRAELSREEARQAVVRRELRRATDLAWRERFGVWPVWVTAPYGLRVCQACGRPY